jgi:hypothetical protein
MKVEQGRIAAEGMGGFLNPPGHPEHKYSVKWGMGRTQGRDVGSMSLSYATTVEWLDETTKEKAKALLHEWETEQRHVIDRDWVQQVLGYFSNCYRNPRLEGEEAWEPSNCLITSSRRLAIMDYVDEHLGVHFIRKFYPDFTPTFDDFEKAYWGDRPVSQ